MDKKRLHHYWAKIRPVSYWYFLVAFLISLAVSVHALRQNNLEMIRLRNQVTKVDKSGGDVEKALRKLREHIYSHMNTNLVSGPSSIKPPIQLKYRYERLVKAETAKASKSSADIYSAAQKICEQKYPESFSGGPRVPCIADYVASHGVKVKTIPDSLYKFDFVSPLWSPDLAGWGLVVTALFLFLFVLRFGLEKWTKSELQTHD
ncbi:MAG TPA: hypothetical protein VJJ78_02320 [Candidatus Saccharimonadales bacterium]|nr:hypothetical protein [Candidatus Saccharimonadales bacterium]